MPKHQLFLIMIAVMGEKITLTSKDKCIVMIAAPGDAMNVHEQNPPTDLTIYLD